MCVSLSGAFRFCSPVGQAPGSVLLGFFFWVVCYLSYLLRLGLSLLFSCLLPFGFGHSGLCWGSSLCSPLLPCAYASALLLGLWGFLLFLIHGCSLLSPLLVFLRLFCVSFPLQGFSGSFLCSFSSYSFLFFAGSSPPPLTSPLFVGFLPHFYWRVMGPCPPFLWLLLEISSSVFPHSPCVLSCFPPGVCTVASHRSWGFCSVCLFCLFLLLVPFSFSWG